MNDGCVAERLVRRDQGETRPLSPWIPSTPRKGQGLRDWELDRHRVLGRAIDPDLVGNGWRRRSRLDEALGTRRVRGVEGALAYAIELEMATEVNVGRRETPRARGHALHR